MNQEDPKQIEHYLQLRFLFLIEQATTNYPELHPCKTISVEEPGKLHLKGNPHNYMVAIRRNDKAASTKNIISWLYRPAEKKNTESVHNTKPINPTKTEKMKKL